MRGLLAEYGCAQTRSHTHALLHTRIVAPSHTPAHSRTHAHTGARTHTFGHTHAHAVTPHHPHAQHRMHAHTHTPCVVSTDSNHLRPERREAHGRRAGCQLGGSPGLWPPVLGRNANHAETGSANVPFPLLATVEPGAFSCAGARLPPPGRCPRSVEESSGQGAVATWAPGRCLHGLRGRPLSRPVARLSSCASAVPSASPARPPGRGSARGSGFHVPGASGDGG